MTETNKKKKNQKTLIYLFCRHLHCSTERGVPLFIHDFWLQHLHFGSHPGEERPLPSEHMGIQRTRLKRHHQQHCHSGAECRRVCQHHPVARWKSTFKRLQWVPCFPNIVEFGEMLLIQDTFFLSCLLTHLINVS